VDLLPACASFLLLATTNHLCQNIAVFRSCGSAAERLLLILSCASTAIVGTRKTILPIYAWSSTVWIYGDERKCPETLSTAHSSLHAGCF